MMNRIVIIGNGFDLSHSFKTSYDDFIFWFFYTKIEGVIEGDQNSYSDDFIEISSSNGKLSVSGSIKKCDSIDELKKDENLKWFSSNVRPLFGSEKNLYANYNIIIKSSFLEGLITSKKNWTDIEKYYFNFLIKSKYSTGGYNESMVKHANEVLEQLRSSLTM